jgi:NDMA-dependent alcohol dehydrogenase
VRSRAAVLRHQPALWDVVEVEVDKPREHEVLVRTVATGLCHSDDHHAKDDQPTGHFPYCGGHEGAGVVEEIGPAVRGLKVGDHVATAFIPGCGRCRFCASGLQNMCDNGALMGAGCQLDGTYRMHLDGLDVAQSCFVGTFSNFSVMPEWSCIKISPDIPFRSAAIIGCGVPTGWGSAVYGAQTKPGDVIIVMGTGGIGMNAVQGASHAGAERVIAVDPVEMKRELALKLGATDAFASIDEAADLARSITNGRGADGVIIAVGVPTGTHVGEAFRATSKAGTIVLTGVANMHDADIKVPLAELTLYQKRIQGVLYGMMSPSRDIPRLLSLYQSGILKLDELVSRPYTIDEINVAYEDMHAGLNIRGVIDF